MTVNLDRIADFVWESEGGYSDDKEDFGNWLDGVFIGSNYGVSAYDLATWIYPTPINPLIMQSLSKRVAEAIFAAKYYNAMDGNNLPTGVDLMVVDFGYNTGVGNSGHVLQKCLGFIGSDYDGFIGPKTIKATVAMDRDTLLMLLYDEQIRNYKGDAQFSLYGSGWIARTMRRHDAAVEMIKAELGSVKA